LFNINSVDEIKDVIDGLKKTLNLIDQNDSDKYDLIDAINYEIRLLETRIKEIKRIR
jgi:hypothetical protein